MSMLRLTKGAMDPQGLITFRLGLWVDGIEVRHWATNSGSPGVQHLRTYDDPKSRPGNLEPIPEREYKLGPLEFAGSDYQTWFSPALGPVWVSIFAPGDTDSRYRGAFGIHLDANRRMAPGSAGCVVFPTMESLQDFVNWHKKHDPGLLVVDHGFGTVQGPPGETVGETKTEPKDWKVYLGPQEGSKLVDTVTIDANGRATMTAQVLAALTGHKLVVNNKARAIRFEPQ